MKSERQREDLCGRAGGGACPQAPSLDLRVQEPRAAGDSRPRRASGARVERVRGFTLIEVLAAIFVLALAAVVLGAAYANTLGAHAAVAQRALVGSNMDFLRDAVLNEPEREKVEEGGEVPLPENRQLRWEAKIEEAPVPDLFKVTVTGRVSGARPGEAEEFTQVLMLLRPTWSDPQRREQIRSEWRAAREEAEKK